MFPIFLENDPIGNAIAAMLWGWIIATAVGLLLAALRYRARMPAKPRASASRVRRRVIL